MRQNLKKTNIEFPWPDIIMRDVNIPHEEVVPLLKEIKRDRDAWDIPVIVLTNSINFDE